MDLATYVNVAHSVKAILPLLPTKTRQKLFFMRRDDPESMHLGRKEFLNFQCEWYLSSSFVSHFYVKGNLSKILFSASAWTLDLAFPGSSIDPSLIQGICLSGVWMSLKQ